MSGAAAAAATSSSPAAPLGGSTSAAYTASVSSSTGRFLRGVTTGRSLFRLRRLLHIASPTTAAPAASAAPAARPARVCVLLHARGALAVGGSGASVTALYLTNDFLVLLLQPGSSRAAVARHVPWFGDPARRVVAMAFAPDGDALLCVCADGSLHTVPVRALLAPRLDEAATAGAGSATAAAASAPLAAAAGASGSLAASTSTAVATPTSAAPASSLTSTPTHTTAAAATAAADRRHDLYSLPSVRGIARTATAVAWWRTPSGEPVAVVGTRSGALHLVDLRSGLVREKLSVPGRGSVVSVRLMHGYQGVAGTVHALVAAEGGTHALFLLQQETVNAEGQTVLEHLLSAGRRSPAFAPVKPSWKTKLPVELQLTERPEPRFCVRSRSAVSVYSEAVDRGPLYIYGLPPDTAQLAMSDRLMYCLATRDDCRGGQLHIVSCLLAAAAVSREGELSLGPVPLEVITLPEQEIPLAIFLDDQLSSHACTIVTDTAIYECSMRQNPEDLCRQLLLEGYDPDVLAATLRLNLPNIERTAADALFEQRAYRQSLEMYMRARTSHAFVIAKFAEAEQMWLVYHYLQRQLASPKAHTSNVRKKLTDLLMLTLLYHTRRESSAGLHTSLDSSPAAARDRSLSFAARSLRPPSDSSRSARSQAVADVGDSTSVGSAGTSRGAVGLDQALTSAELSDVLKSFLNDNWDYDINTTLPALLAHGMLDTFFQAAHAKAKVPTALAMPLNRGVLRLPQATLHYLRARDYADALCEYGGGAFLHGMTPDDAIDFLTARATALGRAVRLAGPFVPALSEPALMKLAAFLNPGRSSVKQILQTAAARRQAQKAGGAAAAAGAGGTRLTNGRPGGKHDDEDGADETNNGDLINGSRQPTSDPVALAGSEPVDAISLVELYLEVLLALQRRRDAADKYKYDLATYAPWHLQPATLLTGLTGTFEEFGILANREGTGVTDLDASGLAVRAFSVDADVARSHNRLDEGLAYGRQHGAAITRAGDLFTWGKASGGRLGHGGIIEEGSYMPPLRVETLNMHGIRVQGVACGAEHTLARTDHGVFAWGANDHGQLGLDDTEMRTHPQQVPTLGDDVHMSSVVCGGFHSMAMARDGRIWGWGANAHGQLGLHMADDVLKPTQLHDLDRRHVIQLAAGATHSCALTEDGAVVVFGTGALGQLGRDSGGIRQWEPLQLQLPNRSGARLVAAGPYQTLVVMRDGSAYIMGRSLFDTRKLPTDAKALARYRSSGPCPPLLTPTAVPLTMSGNNIAQVVVGLNHALFLMEDGSVSSYGVGQHGVLGHGDPKDRAQPAKVAALGDRKMEFVAVGEHSSAALDVQGHVWVWGCDLTSELNAQGLLAERALPVHLKSVPAVRTGRRGSLGSSISGSRASLQMSKASVVLPATPTAKSATQASTPTNSVSSMSGLRARSATNSDRPAPSLTFANMPDCSSTSVPFSGWTLPMSLTALQRFYRPTYLLRRCRDWDVPVGVSQVYALLGSFADALEHRLQDLTLRRQAVVGPDGVPPHFESDEEWAVRVFDVAKPYMVASLNQLHAVGMDVRISACKRDVRQCILVVAEYAEKHNLPHSVLDQVIRLGLEDSARMVLDLAREAQMAPATPAGAQPSTRPSGGSPGGGNVAVIHQGRCGRSVPAVLAELSPILYLDAALVSLSQMNKLSGRPEGALMTEQHVANILNNIDKDLGERDAIMAPLLPKGSGSTKMASPSGKFFGNDTASTVYDTVVFTCGHHFARDSFMDVVLPALVKRLSELPINLEEWTNLVAQLYAQDRPPMACPLCVFGRVRRHILDVMPHEDVASWTSWR